MAVPSIVQKASGFASVLGTSIAATFGVAPTAGNLLIGFTNMVAVGTPASWPAGWFEVATLPQQTPGGSNGEGMSIATRIAGAGEPTLVTVNGPNFDRRSIHIFEIAGGSYGTVAMTQTPGSTTVNIPAIGPPAGAAALLLGQVHWAEAVARLGDPVAYVQETETVPNTGGHSVRCTTWSRAIAAATGGPYSGVATTTGAGIIGTGAQVSITSGGVPASRGEPGGSLW